MNRPTIRQCLRGKIRIRFGVHADRVIEAAEDSGDLEDVVDDALLAVTQTVDKNPEMNEIEAEELGLVVFLEGVEARIAALPVNSDQTASIA